MKCPKCNVEVPGKFCRQCGSPVRVWSSSAAPPVVQPVLEHHAPGILPQELAVSGLRFWTRNQVLLVGSVVVLALAAAGLTYWVVIRKSAVNIVPIVENPPTSQPATAVQNLTTEPQSTSPPAQAPATEPQEAADKQQSGASVSPPASNISNESGCKYAQTQEAILDELNGSSIGQAYGIQWTQALGTHGTVFDAVHSSRIEYPTQIAREGTIEIWIRVNSGYDYQNGAFRQGLGRAMIFSTDAEGEDVTWPGTTKLFVSQTGDVSF